MNESRTPGPVTSDVPRPSVPARPGMSPDVPLHRRDHVPVDAVTEDVPELDLAPRPGLSPDVPLHPRHGDAARR